MAHACDLDSCELSAIEHVTSAILTEQVEKFRRVELTIEGRSIEAMLHRVETPDGAALMVIVLTAGASSLPGPAELRSRFNLTPRESEVALLLAERRSNKEIARSKGFTSHTAERHTEKVLSKLGIGSRKEVLGVLRGPAGVV